MIRPPGLEGVVFSQARECDLRNDLRVRARFSSEAGISPGWATVDQVHGDVVLRAGEPGVVGTADAIWTTETGLPVAVFTADCYGVALVSPGAVGVAHAGWRGARSGVVAKLASDMTRAGHSPTRAAIGPGIGPCCFEVGAEVLKEFPGHVAKTSWGSDSVDLTSVVLAQLDPIETWSSGLCTYHDDDLFSHRRDGSSRRLAAVGVLA